MNDTELFVFESDDARVPPATDAYVSRVSGASADGSSLNAATLSVCRGDGPHRRR